MRGDVVDLEKLNSKIKEIGIKKKAIAKEFGISVQALNKKLAGDTKITVDDASIFCEVLRIKSDKEKVEIFL